MHKYYLSQVIKVFPGRMDAWLPSGWSMFVQVPCAVHGTAGTGIPYFSPLIVSVKNVLLLNDMQQVLGFLEMMSQSSQSCCRPVECEGAVEKLCSCADLWHKDTSGALKFDSKLNLDMVIAYCALTFWKCLKPAF